MKTKSKPKMATKAFMRKWVTALRSGKFKQSRESLKDNVYDGAANKVGVGYCCLGVACLLKAREEGSKLGLYKYARHGLEELAGAWLLPLGDQRKLADKNDRRLWSFDRIADYIEKEYINAPR